MEFWFSRRAACQAVLLLRFVSRHSQGDGLAGRPT